MAGERERERERLEMAGAGAVAQRALAQQVGLISGSAQGPLSASQINSLRVTAVAERLTVHLRSGSRSDPAEFFQLCLSLARGIDYAIANSDTPHKAQVLPAVLKQVYDRKNERNLQAAVMVLMISVKNACKNGWFSVQDADELLTLANEMGRSFCSPQDVNIEPSSLPHVISNVMSRFFPMMKIGHVLASLEVKPGFGAFAVDFHILRENISTLQEKIRLFVVQTDSISTSSCLISPPKVNFLLNGRGVDRRIDVSMDPGPQLATNVTTMLKYGTNLLQAVGQFNGNCIIAIAFVTIGKSSGGPALQDYVQPAALESDSEIIEGSSRISLNCPISLKRIKTPVKGQLCKHRQCFDFENYIEINSRRPSWRCPHCNQSVCYIDIRIDQYMVEVLREVAKNVADVVVSADGSWKPVMESDNQMDEHHERSPGCEKDGSGQFEPTPSSSRQANVVDLTMEDSEENEAMDTSELEDRKPFKDGLPDYSVGAFPVSSEINNSTEVTQAHCAQVEDDFWSGIYFPGTFNGTTAPGISEPLATNSMITPVLTDAVSSAFNREFVDARVASQTTTPIAQAHTFNLSNLQLQPPEFANSLITTDFGRPIPRYVDRNPIAVQALPAQSQVPASHNRLRVNTNSLMSNGSHSSQTPIMPPPFDAVSNSEAERHQQFSMSSPMLHYSMAQNWDHQGRPYMPVVEQIVGLPATSQVPSSYRGSSAQPSERHNPQTISRQPILQGSTHSHPLNIRQGGTQGTSSQDGGPTSSHSRTVATGHRSSRVARSPPAVPVQLQAPRTGSSFPATADWQAMANGEQRGMNMGSVSRAEVANEWSSEQNWRPTGRMRGSLHGRAYSDALNQFMIQPTHSSPVATQPSDLSSPLNVSPQLQGLISNNINSRVSAQQVYARTGNTSGSLGNRP